MTPESKEQKISKAAVAAVIAASMLVGGTFAWASLSPNAPNEGTHVVNVGGRLHDDFNGTNKDVYVENFTNAVRGGQPVYARVRLDEYMEIGDDAGSGGVDADKDGKLEAEPIVSGTDRKETDTWVNYNPMVKSTDEDNTIHDYWTWTLGGKTTYMPTFNKDKDSLKAETNGTYTGTSDQDRLSYDDYVVYTTNSTTGGKEIPKEEKEAYEGSIYSITGDADYDDDIDKIDNGGTVQSRETHEAKTTATGTVISIEDWDGTPGNYWIFDTDGWAYWANPIMPGEASGLLLDEIRITKHPGEKCYYGINVVGEFATALDWEYFNNGDGLTGDALRIMETAADSVPRVTITSDVDYASVGQTYTFKATASRNGFPTDEDSGFEWFLADQYGRPIDPAYSTITLTEDGMELTLKDTVPDSTPLYVSARSLDPNHLGAVGIKAIVARNEAALIPQVSISLDQTNITNTKDISLTADVIHNLAEYEDPELIWTTTAADTVAEVDGNTLTILQAEGEVTFDLTASCTIKNKTGTDTVTVKLDASDFCDTCGEKYDQDGLCPDGCDGGYQPAVLTADGGYEVANAGQMFYMANKVNAGETDVDITLTEDIDLDGKPWTSIGNETNLYTGTFDGGNHSITGLSVEADGANQGFFGIVSAATVKNFSVDGTIEIDGTAADSRFGVIGNARTGSIISGIHSDVDIIVVNPSDTKKITYLGGVAGSIDNAGTTVKECSYSGIISGRFETAGGIVGYGGYGNAYSIKDCLFVGTISQTQEYTQSLLNKGSETIFAGGIIGYHNAASTAAVSITDCLSYGTIAIGDGTVEVTGAGALLGTQRGSQKAVCSNLYYCVEDGSSLPAYGKGKDTTDRVNSETEAKGVTVTQLKDGTVCGLLNDDGGSTWKQGTNYPKPNQW